MTNVVNVSDGFLKVINSTACVGCGALVVLVVSGGVGGMYCWRGVRWTCPAVTVFDVVVL